MKKWLLYLIVVLVLAAICCYAFIPNIISIKNEEDIHVTQQGLHRVLLDKENVKKWWPGTISNTGAFVYNGNNYTFINNNISLIAVTITNDDDSINTSLYMVSLATDSVRLTWIGKAATSYNVLKRFTKWRAIKNVSDDLSTLMKKMKSFYSNDENVYGIKVEKALVMDSILITTGGYSKEYPSTEFIYGLVDKLKTYAAANGAKEAGYPMLNIEKNDTTDYNVRVAIPLDKRLADAPGIGCKRMLGLGNILVAEVKGGNAVTAEVFKQIGLYASDYQRTPPAIPFYSLITDRRKEPDSAKWITKVYFPVM